MLASPGSRPTCAPSTPRNFAHDVDIGTPRVVATCLEQAGADPGPTLEAARTQASKDALPEATRTAAEAGVFGAPTFRVEDELFWGNDRLEDALEEARGRGAPPPV